MHLGERVFCLAESCNGLLEMGWFWNGRFKNKRRRGRGRRSTIILSQLFKRLAIGLHWRWSWNRRRWSRRDGISNRRISSFLRRRPRADIYCSAIWRLIVNRSHVSIPSFFRGHTDKKNEQVDKSCGTRSKKESYTRRPPLQLTHIFFARSKQDAQATRPHRSQVNLPRPDSQIMQAMPFFMENRELLVFLNFSPLTF